MDNYTLPLNMKTDIKIIPVATMKHKTEINEMKNFDSINEAIEHFSKLNTAKQQQESKKKKKKKYERKPLIEDLGLTKKLDGGQE